MALGEVGLNWTEELGWCLGVFWTTGLFSLECRRILLTCIAYWDASTRVFLIDWWLIDSCRLLPWLYLILTADWSLITYYIDVLVVWCQWISLWLNLTDSMNKWTSNSGANHKAYHYQYATDRLAQQDLLLLRNQKCSTLRAVRRRKLAASYEKYLTKGNFSVRTGFIVASYFIIMIMMLS